MNIIKPKNLKNIINIDDILTILYWVKTFYLFENKSFAYQNLLDQAETYKLSKTDFDVTLHPIDELMIDAYKIYYKLKETKDSFLQILDYIAIPLTKSSILEEVKKYQTIFENLMENYKYEDPEIRGIQKGILNEKMKEYVSKEDYENAARMRDMIKEC